MPSLSPELHSALHALILRVFSPTEFRIWLRDDPETPEVIAFLPESAPFAEFVSEWIMAFERRGKINTDLLDRLSKARPNAVDSISVLRRQLSRRNTNPPFSSNINPLKHPGAIATILTTTIVSGLYIYQTTQSSNTPHSLNLPPPSDGSPDCFPMILALADLSEPLTPQAHQGALKNSKPTPPRTTRSCKARSSNIEEVQIHKAWGTSCLMERGKYKFSMLGRFGQSFCQLKTCTTEKWIISFTLKVCSGDCEAANCTSLLDSKGMTTRDNAEIMRLVNFTVESSTRTSICLENTGGASIFIQPGFTLTAERTAKR